MLSQLKGEGSRREDLAILWYSHLRADRGRDHHGLEPGQGRLKAVCEVRRLVGRVEEMSNYLARALAVTLVRQVGKETSTIATLTADQSRRAQCRVGGRSIMASGCTVMTVATWSKPQQGRGLSPEDTMGERAEFAKARSNTDSLEVVSKGKRM